MATPAASDHSRRRATYVRAARLLLWMLTSFGVVFFARDLDQVVWGWPVNFWWAAQGGVLVFIGIGMVYAWCMNRLDPHARQHEAGEGSSTDPRDV